MREINLKRIISVCLTMIILISLVPTAWADEITNLSKAHGSDYTTLPGLAAKLDIIFAGDIDLYADEDFTKEVHYAIGDRMDITRDFYSPNGKPYAKGKQCFIYANAVYQRLFGESPRQAQYAVYSEIVLKNVKDASFTLFSKAGVRTGAYLRSTANADGTYNSYDGHSLIVLSYNSSTICYLEGNADGKGLVRISRRTWNEFNQKVLSGRGRRLCHVIQPKQSHFDGLYAAAPTVVLGPRLLIDRSCITIGESVTFSLSLAAQYELTIKDAEGGSVSFVVPSDTLKYPFTKPGEYTASAEIINGSKRTPVGSVKFAVRDKNEIPDPVEQFADLRARDWYCKNGAVQYVTDNLLFNGVSKTEFAPNDNMTRAMFVTVLGRLAGAVVNNEAPSAFVDVERGAWYAGYVVWAAERGIVSGMSPSKFDPNGNVTREQICKMMVTYCSYADIELKHVNPIAAFGDESKISSWARDFVTKCQIGGLVNGRDNGNFDPKGNATRAEVATILYNFDQNY